MIQYIGVGFVPLGFASNANRTPLMNEIDLANEEGTKCGAQTDRAICVKVVTEVVINVESEPGK